MLSRLPWEAAATRLASLIMQSPDWSIPPQEAKQLAFRLVVLLPRGGSELPHAAGVDVRRVVGLINRLPLKPISWKWFLLCTALALAVLQLLGQFL